MHPSRSPLVQTHLHLSYVDYFSKIAIRKLSLYEADICPLRLVAWHAGMTSVLTKQSVPRYLGNLSLIGNKPTNHRDSRMHASAIRNTTQARRWF
jgi:hypothetical protein